MPDPNYYEMLEIAPTATQEEVREAYRLLTMVWHPDRFPKDSKLWTHANERMQQINEAYNALKNIKDGDPRPMPEPNASAQSAATESRPSAVEEERRRQQELARQRLEARQRAEEQQRRVQEQKRLEDERRRQEAVVRLNLETEQRRQEADRLRVLMRESQRVDDIQHQRAAQGLCPLCGQPLSAMDKLTRRSRHRDCSVFIDDRKEDGANATDSDLNVQETASDS